MLSTIENRMIILSDSITYLRTFLVPISTSVTVTKVICSLISQSCQELVLPRTFALHRCICLTFVLLVSVIVPQIIFSEVSTNHGQSAIAATRQFG